MYRWTLGGATGITWAKWRFQNNEQKAVRLHMELHLLNAQAANVWGTEGETCELAALKLNLQIGIVNIGGRNYSHSYELLNEIVTKGCGFLSRARESTCFTMIKRNEVDAAAQREGCISTQWRHWVEKGLPNT